MSYFIQEIISHFDNDFEEHQFVKKNDFFIIKLCRQVLNFYLG